MWVGEGHASTPEHKRLKALAKRVLDYRCATPGCDADERLELDHIVNLKAGGQHNLDNVQWLCHKHHAQKTAREAAKARKPTRYKRQAQRPLGC